MESANSFKRVVLGIERLTIRRESPLPLWGFEFDPTSKLSCSVGKKEWNGNRKRIIPIVNT